MIPRPRPVQSPRLIADRQFRLRGGLERIGVLAARAEFLILMRDDRIDAVLEPHLRPDASALLPLEQFRVQHAGVHDHARRVLAALSLVSIVRASKKIDNALITIIDSPFEGRMKYRWPLLFSLGRGDDTPCLLSRNDGCVRHHRRTQGTSWPSRRHRSIAA